MHLFQSKTQSGTPSVDELKLNQGEFLYSTEAEIAKEDAELSKALAEGATSWIGKCKREVSSKGILYLGDQRFILRTKSVAKIGTQQVLPYWVTIQIHEVGKQRYQLIMNEAQEVVAAFEIKAARVDSTQNLVERGNSRLPSISECLEDLELGLRLTGFGNWQGSVRRAVTPEGIFYLGNQKFFSRIKTITENEKMKRLTYPFNVRIQELGKLRYLLIISESPEQKVMAVFEIQKGKVNPEKPLLKKGNLPLPSLSECLEDLELGLRLTGFGNWQGSVRRTVSSRGFFFLSDQKFVLRSKQIVENGKHQSIPYSVTVRICEVGKQRYLLIVNDEKEVMGAFEIHKGKIDPAQNLAHRVQNRLPKLNEYLEDLELGLRLLESGNWLGKVDRSVQKYGTLYLGSYKFMLRTKSVVKNGKQQEIPYSVTVSIHEVGNLRYLMIANEALEVVAAFEIYKGKINSENSLISRDPHAPLSSLNEYLEDLEFGLRLNDFSNWLGTVERKVNSQGFLYLGNQKIELERKRAIENGKRKEASYPISLQIHEINQQRYVLILDESTPDKKVLSVIPIQSGQMVLDEQILYSFQEAVALDAWLKQSLELGFPIPANEHQSRGHNNLITALSDEEDSVETGTGIKSDNRRDGEAKNKTGAFKRLSANQIFERILKTVGIDYQYAVDESSAYVKGESLAAPGAEQFLKDFREILNKKDLVKKLMSQWVVTELGAVQTHYRSQAGLIEKNIEEQKNLNAQLPANESVSLSVEDIEKRFEKIKALKDIQELNAGLESILPRYKKIIQEKIEALIAQDFDWDKGTDAFEDLLQSFKEMKRWSQKQLYAAEKLSLAKHQEALFKLAEQAQYSPADRQLLVTMTRSALYPMSRSDHREKLWQGYQYEKQTQFQTELGKKELAEKRKKFDLQFDQDYPETAVYFWSLPKLYAGLKKLLMKVRINKNDSAQQLKNQLEACTALEFKRLWSE